MLLAQNEGSTLQTKRAHERLNFNEACLIQTEKRALHGRTENISEGGMCFTLQGLGTLKRGETISLSIHTLAPVECIVRWISDRKIGVQFAGETKDHQLLNTLIDRLKTGEPAHAATPQQRDETPGIPMKEIIDWVKGLD